MKLLRLGKPALVAAMLLLVSWSIELWGTAGTCQACHIITQIIGQSEYTSQGNANFTPVSDFALRDTGIGLADGISHAGRTGAARCSTRGPCDIRCHSRSAASTSDLHQAIIAHASKGSEADTAISNVEMLSPADLPALLNFLRSL